MSKENFSHYKPSPPAPSITICYLWVSPAQEHLLLLLFLLFLWESRPTALFLLLLLFLFFFLSSHHLHQQLGGARRLPETVHRLHRVLGVIVTRHLQVYISTYQNICALVLVLILEY